MRRFLLLFSLFLSLATSAQQKKDSFWSDLNDFLNKREDKTYAKLDSNYIGRYPYHWDARLFYTSTGLQILNQGKDFLMTSPHMVIAPTCCILVTVLGFQRFGVGLRDALDPRMK